MLKRSQRGDTIIEVMIAITIFSMVAVGAMAVMNQGMASAERSLEITLVRQQMDSQAEALRYFNSAYVANYAPGKTDYDLATPAGQWYALLHNPATSKVASGASPYGQCSDDKGALKAPSAIASAPFIINTATARVSSLMPAIADTYAQVHAGGSSDAQAAGIWIEAVLSDKPADSSVVPRYVDFHIRACWSSPGQAVPVTLGTIVRLYEPTE
jgi:prepilin-type N-terminal cleavage/methylation domain-containing protein